MYLLYFLRKNYNSYLITNSELIKKIILIRQISNIQND